MSAGPVTSEPSTLGAVARALEGKAAYGLGHGVKEQTSLLWRIGTWVIGGLAIGALALSSFNIVARFFNPAWTLDLSDEVQIYLIVWALMLALGAVTLADQHVKADLFVSMFPEILQRAVSLFGELLGLAFALLLLWYGARAAYGSWDYGDLSATSLRFPLWIYVAALPAGAFAMAFAYLVRIGRRLKSTAH